MAGDQGGGTKFEKHPLIERLEAGKKGPAVRLAGYIGGRSAEGLVRLHPNLDDLSEYLEVNEADVIDVDPAPASELPHGGHYIWVKADAAIKRNVTQRASARFFAGGIASGNMQPGATPMSASADPQRFFPGTPVVDCPPNTWFFPCRLPPPPQTPFGCWPPRTPFGHLCGMSPFAVTCEPGAMCPPPRE